MVRVVAGGEGRRPWLFLNVRNGPCTWMLFLFLLFPKRHSVTALQQQKKKRRWRGVDGGVGGVDLMSR